MKVKHFIAFCAVLLVFMLFAAVYDAAANKIRTPATSGDGLYAASISQSKELKFEPMNKNGLELPKYTAIAKPAGAPQIIENEEEIEALLTKK